MTIKILPSYYSPIGFQKLTVTSSEAVGFTLPSSPDTRAIVFSVEGGTIRMKVDGNDPTTTEGMALYDGDVVELTNANMILNCKLISVSADVTVQAHFFGGGL